MRFARRYTGSTAQADRGGDARQDGFTLIETLVALGVLAVIGALMSGFLQQLSSVNRFEEEISKQTEIEAATGYLQRLLEGIQPLVLLDAEPDTRPLMDGKATSLSAAVVMRQGVYSLGLRDIRVFVQEEDGKRNLVQVSTPRRMQDGEPVVANSAPIPIADSIRSLQFEYADNGSWSSSFGKEGALPNAIRITLEAEVRGRTLSAVSVATIR